MTITLAPSSAQTTYGVASRTAGTSIVDESQAVNIVAAMIGLANYYEANEDILPDAEYRSMRATQIGAALQPGFLIIEDTIGMPLSNYSDLDHQLIEQGINHALKTEIDEEAESVLNATAYLLSDGMKIVTE